MANLRSSIIDLDAADCDILPSEFQDQPSRDHIQGVHQLHIMIQASCIQLCRVVEVFAAGMGILRPYTDSETRATCEGSGGLMDCSTSASAPQDKISTVSKGANTLRHLDLCDGMDVSSSC